MLTKFRYLILWILFSAVLRLEAQRSQDTLATKRLEEITIKGEKEVNLERLPDIEGTRIWSGKKNELLTIKNLDANIAEKTARQVFAKVPGVFVYDMDGTETKLTLPHVDWTRDP